MRKVVKWILWGSVAITSAMCAIAAIMGIVSAITVDKRLGDEAAGWMLGTGFFALVLGCCAAMYQSMTED